MLISHESPISILDHSIHYNDYDYCLVHLLETHPEYHSFFKRTLAMGREVLLDNSIFELGTAFDSSKFAEYVEELKPTFYVVPDVLEDTRGTIESFKKFVSEYPDLPGLKIGVVQGKTYQELVECYKFMSENADYIAISFDYSWYQAVGYSTYRDDRGKLERYCTGRQYLIESLIADGFWNKDKPHHLLGASLAREFKNYKSIPSIRSVDTSNPIVAGIKGLRYIREIGLNSKPSVKLADLIDHEVSADEMQDIIHNVDEFRAIVG